jgi:hypothetical protein
MPNGRCRMHGGKSTGAPKGNKQRIAAQYIDPLLNGTWTRPVIAAPQALATQYVQEVRNDYSSQRERYTNLELYFKDDDPELFEALQGWPDRPTLS